jgi:hypothetical protein
VICLIVIASFAVFAIDQTKSASVHQQQQLAGASPADATGRKSAVHKGEVHKAIDDVSGQLTSPFSGVVSGSSGEWAVRGTKLLLALLVYGFGLGFLARTLRVRL